MAAKISFSVCGDLDLKKGKINTKKLHQHLMIYEMNNYSFMKNKGCLFSDIFSYFGMLCLKK
jgi:hypothetical protein